MADDTLPTATAKTSSYLVVSKLQELVGKTSRICNRHSCTFLSKQINQQLTINMLEEVMVLII